MGFCNLFHIFAFGGGIVNRCCNMLDIKRMVVWLGRIGRCRGFGVQSPWAYRMVRYVINEHWPYYAYADLKALHPSLAGGDRRLCELCFRLANHVQPRMAVICGAGNVPFGEYIKAGCRRAGITELPDGGATGSAMKADMAVIGPGGGFGDMFAAFASEARDGAVAVLLDIHGSKAMRRLWREIVRDTQGVVTFDLYWCGLVFFDKNRFKQNYIINF